MTIDFDFTLDGARVDQAKVGVPKESVLPEVERRWRYAKLIHPCRRRNRNGTAGRTVVGKFRFPVSYVSDVNANFIRFNGLGEPTRASRPHNHAVPHVARCPKPHLGRRRWATTTRGLRR